MTIEIVNDPHKKYNVESLRKKVFNLQGVGRYYLDQILYGKEFVLAATEDKKIIGGCYFHRFENILFIDQVFVKEEYQNSGLEVGRVLINSLLINKDLMEKELGDKITMCRISANNEKAKSLYKKIGFKESKLDSSDLLKPIL